MTTEYTRWVACWGNATSIIDQKECTYSKDLTLRYPVRIFFSGSRLRFHFSNIAGRESVRIADCTAAKQTEGSGIDPATLAPVTFGGKTDVLIPSGGEIVSDEISFNVIAGETISVSIYFKDYTDMNSGVLITGPLSTGYYSYGKFTDAAHLPDDLTRNTNWFYFLNTVDILTEEKNHALICYGDSITAQDWPDYLKLRAWEEGFHDIAVIRRAISGTRILRQYSCITYAAYGLSGKNRFEREIETAGTDRVLIQHGINDIIHPVGTDVNIFRPLSDLPTAMELEEGVRKIYVEPARKKGLKVYSGTLLPIEGWRTYAPFREKLKEEFNSYLRGSTDFDGCADFDLVLRDPNRPAAFREGFDSGDHLHPSAAAYKAMADAIPTYMLK